MTLYQFSALSEQEQANLIWDGVFLDVVTIGDDNVLLYALEAFFVEVHYAPSLNKIRKLRPFKSIELLDPYLNTIPPYPF